MKNEKIDIVNTHTRFFISSLLGLIMAKKQGLPLVHTEHGSTFVKDSSLFTRFVARVYDETLGRLVITSATKLFGVSKSCIEFASRLGGKNGIVIYNGIDTDFWNTEERLPNKVTNITFCGRMVKGKGVHDLLKALAQLKSHEWNLQLVGDGNYLLKLKELATELKINDRIVWHGDQDRFYLKSILEKTDIFVNPSYTEGLPTSVLEAGAMRCAVIATNVGGTNEIINNEENGLLIPAHIGIENTAFLFTALESILYNPEVQRKYGNAIAESIEKKFSWSVIAKIFSHHFLKET
jgi:glycosyltransferase involved in cell wall biosynthesis